MTLEACAIDDTGSSERESKEDTEEKRKSRLIGKKTETGDRNKGLSVRKQGESLLKSRDEDKMEWEYESVSRRIEEIWEEHKKKEEGQRAVSMVEAQ